MLRAMTCVINKYMYTCTCMIPTNNLTVCGLIPRALTNFSLLSTVINDYTNNNNNF